MQNAKGLGVAVAITACLFLIHSAGCTKVLVDAQVGGLKKGAEAIYTYNNPDLLGKALPGIIIKNEGYIYISPDNPFYLVSTADLYYLYAMAFLESSDKELAKKMYARDANSRLHEIRSVAEARRSVR